MVTRYEMQLPSDRDSKPDYKLEQPQFHSCQLKLESDRSMAGLMEGCCRFRRRHYSRVVDSKQHHESDLTFASAAAATAAASTTMETDDSSRIMNQSTETATANAMHSGRNRFASATTTAAAAATIHASGENSNLHLVEGAVWNLARDKWKNTNPGGRGCNSTFVGEGYPGVGSWLRCRLGWSTNARTTLNWGNTTRIISRSHYRAPMGGSCFWLQEMWLLVTISACLVQAGFWTFYFPNFLKASGYHELTGMIETVDKQINSTMDAHADAKYFWGLMREPEPGPSELYYPEESACEEVFPLFRDRAIEYAEIDYRYYLEPLMSYREHLLEKRDLWFPGGSNSKSILPREYEHGLCKLDLELKIASFDRLANEPKLRQMREGMVNIWRNVKRNLDSSLACLYLRYSYRHMAADINQLALEMNLKSLHQALEMLESAYKRVTLFRDQDRVAIERINEAMEREKTLVMID